MKIRTVNYLT